MAHSSQLDAGQGNGNASIPAMALSIRRYLTTRLLSSGESLFAPGQLKDNLYIIESGIVLLVDGNGQRIEYSAGTIMVGHEFFLHGPSSSTAR